MDGEYLRCWLQCNGPTQLPLKHRLPIHPSTILQLDTLLQSRHNFSDAMAALISIPRNILYHLKTAFLFTKSDIKTTVIPIVSIINAFPFRPCISQCPCTHICSC